MSFVMWTQVDPRQHVLGAGSDPHTWRGNFKGEHARRCPAVDILKANQQGPVPVRCRCWLGCTKWGTHWHNLANTT